MFEHGYDWSWVRGTCVGCGLKVTAELDIVEAGAMENDERIQGRRCRDIVRDQLATYLYRKGCPHLRRDA